MEYTFKVFKTPPAVGEIVAVPVAWPGREEVVKGTVVELLSTQYVLQELDNSLTIIHNNALRCRVGEEE